MKEELNSPRPYSFEIADDFSYRFITDQGIEYKAAFSDCTCDFFITSTSACTCKIYSFALTKVSNEVSVLDPRVFLTIEEILEKFFSESNHVLVYVCMNSDGLEHARHRLFKQWLNKSKLRSQLISIDEVFHEEETNSTYYLSIVYNASSTLSSSLPVMFDSFVYEVTPDK